MDLLEGSRSLIEGERELLFYFGRARMSRSQKRDVGDEKDGYKYPLSPNGHLSRGSATTQVWQCRTAAVPLFKYGSAAPRMIAKVRVKCRLSWL